MPYIAAADRAKLNPAIDELADRLVEQARLSPGDAAFAGLLNYACTRLALAVIKKRFGTVRYWIIATVTGVFHNAADEFYRRLAAPYEDAKIASEGDVDYYEELS